MHVGIANPRWRGKRSRHSRRMRNPQFYVSGKRPMLYHGSIVMTWLTITRLNCIHQFVFVSVNYILCAFPQIGVGMPFCFGKTLRACLLHTNAGFTMNPNSNDTVNILVFLVPNRYRCRPILEMSRHLLCNKCSIFRNAYGSKELITIKKFKWNSKHHVNSKYHHTSSPPK